MDEISESQTFENKKISEDDVLRCPKCYLIPLISINHSQLQSILQFKCNNYHVLIKPLKELYFESKTRQINSIQCKNCNENNILKLFYCIKCKGFYCEKEEHSFNKGHDILIPVSKIDSYCFEAKHQNNYVNVSYYSKTHNKNICYYCLQDKYKDDKDFEKFQLLKQKEFETIKNNIKKVEENLNSFLNKVKSFISNLKKLIEEIINEFNLYKENNELEINLAKDLINIYELKKDKFNLNYQIIQNIKNISFNNDIDFEYNLNNIIEIKNTIFKSHFIEIKNVNEREVKKKVSKQKIDNKLLKKSKIQSSKYNLENICPVESHKDWVTAISVFPSGNIISVSKDESIIIYDINFNISQKINKAHNDGISYVDIKDENNFITCSYDGAIKLWNRNKNAFINYQTFSKAHNGPISKVIYCLNRYFISSSWDKTIKIWSENNNEYQFIITLEHQNRICSILYLEDKNISISSGNDDTKFWNLNLNELNYRNINFITIIDDTCCGWYGGLCRLDEDKIIIQGKSKSFKIISISKKIIIQEINIPFKCWGIYLIKNKGIILTGGKSKDIKIYRNDDNYECIQTIQDAHDDEILGFVELKNGLIASFSYDNKIKIWWIKEI